MGQKPLRVAALVHSLHGRGIQKVILALAEEMLTHGVTTTFFVINNAPQDHHNQDFHAEYIVGTSVSRNKKLFWRKIQDNEDRHGKFDAIIGHCYASYQILSGRQKGRIFLCIHQSYHTNLYRLNWVKKLRKRMIYRKFFLHKDIICVSEGIKKGLVNELGIDPSRARVVYPPIHFSAIKKKANNAFSGISNRYIAYVGSLSLRKNVAMTIRAFALLEDKSIDLIVAGKGDQYENLKDLSRQLGIHNRVHFMGWMDNPYPMLKRAQVVALSSRMEGFGLVIAEALSLGVPVVSTMCPSGPSEILTGHLADYLVEIDDDKRMAECLDKALQSPPRITKESYMRFDIKTIAQEYMCVFSENRSNPSF